MMTTVVSAEYVQVQTRDQLFNYVPKRYFQEHSTMQVGSPYVLRAVGWDYVDIDVSSQDFISLLCVMRHVLESLQLEFNVLDDIPSRYDLPTMDDYLAAFRLASLWRMSMIRHCASEYISIHRAREGLCPYQLASYGMEFSSAELFLAGCADIVISSAPVWRNADKVIGPLLAFRLCLLKATNPDLQWRSTKSIARTIADELYEFLQNMTERDDAIVMYRTLPPSAPFHYYAEPDFAQDLFSPVDVPTRPPSPTRSEVPDEEYFDNSPFINGWSHLPELRQQEILQPDTQVDDPAFVPFIPPSPDLIPISPELAAAEDLDLPPVLDTPGLVSEALPPIRSLAGVAEHLSPTQSVDAELVEWLSNYSDDIYATDASESEDESEDDNDAKDKGKGKDVDDEVTNSESDSDSESDEMYSEEEDSSSVSDYGLAASRKLRISFLLNPAPGWVPPTRSVTVSENPKAVIVNAPQP